MDATAPVAEVTRDAGDRRLRIGLVPQIRRFVAYKGSVALHGVSLTVAGVGQEDFEVALIPDTLDRTNLRGLRRGDRVNVEVDLVARYLERLMGSGAARAPGSQHG